MKLSEIWRDPNVKHPAIISSARPPGSRSEAAMPEGHLAAGGLSENWLVNVLRIVASCRGWRRRISIASGAGTGSVKRGIELRIGVVRRGVNNSSVALVFVSYIGGQFSPKPSGTRIVWRRVSRKYSVVAARYHRRMSKTF